MTILEMLRGFADGDPEISYVPKGRHADRLSSNIDKVATANGYP